MYYYQGADIYYIFAPCFIAHNKITYYVMITNNYIMQYYGEYSIIHE